MKIRNLVFFSLAWLLFSVPLQAAQAPKLETLLAEYKKARADVLGKLNETYAAQADALAGQYQAASNLEGINRTQRFAKLLRDPQDSRELRSTNGSTTSNDPVDMLQANYAQARQANLANVYTFYATTAENLRLELLHQKDEAGAGVLATFLAKIKPDAPAGSGKATPAKPRPKSSK